MAAAGAQAGAREDRRKRSSWAVEVRELQLASSRVAPSGINSTVKEMETLKERTEAAEKERAGTE